MREVSVPGVISLGLAILPPVLVQEEAAEFVVHLVVQAHVALGHDREVLWARFNRHQGVAELVERVLRVFTELRVRIGFHSGFNWSRACLGGGGTLNWPGEGAASNRIEGLGGSEK